MGVTVVISGSQVAQEEQSSSSPSWTSFLTCTYDGFGVDALTRCSNPPVRLLPPQPASTLQCSFAGEQTVQRLHHGAVAEESASMEWPLIISVAMELVAMAAPQPKGLEFDIGDGVTVNFPGTFS